MTVFWCCLGLACLLILLILFLTFGFYCFWHACRRKKQYPADRYEYGGGIGIPEQSLRDLREVRAWLDQAPFEEVSVHAHDGLCLRGRLLTAEGDAKGTVLFFHGYHSSCRRDFSLQIHTLYREGYHILLTSQRAHGESEGRYTTFGVKERLDVAPWCRLVQERMGDLPITLFGLSMGAATVMMAANTDLPCGVHHIVADCGYTDPWTISCHTLRYKHKLHPHPWMELMNLWSRILAGFDYRSCSVSSALRDSRIPVLLIHGAEDRYVPWEMSRQIHEEFPKKTRLLLIPNARHTQAVLWDPHTYLQAVLDFLSE